MKISLDWLKEFIAVKENPADIAQLLTMSGLEVEGVESYEEIAGSMEGLVIGQVLTCGKHPDADKLSVTTVDVGQESPLHIVCGAPNVAQGQKVVVATIGTTLHPVDGEAFKIKKGKIRGQVSEGMICAEDEIGLGTSHEGIMVLDTDLPNGTPAADYFKPFTDAVLEIGLTPNRADAASHYGVARDLKVLLNRPVCFPEVTDFRPDNLDLPIKVTVEDTAACPRYVGVTLTNLKVGPSPAWLQNRLMSIGLSPINNLVDITNYVLHGLGQPLHAFDAAAIKGNHVIVKKLPANTLFVTLDEKERRLAADDLMICNAEGPMCIAGVFGGLHSGVSDTTTSIFLESAYFSPDSVRKTTLVHGLKTDAAFRFERGTDPNMPVKALKVAAMLMKEIAGGSISSEIVDIYPHPIPHFEVELKYANVDRLIGKVISREEIKKILTGLEIQITTETPAGLKLAVPPYRVDVQREADIIEEILRIHGFNNVEIQENLSADFLSYFPETNKDFLQHQLSEILAGSGFREIITNSLTTSEYSKLLKSVNTDHQVTILNTLSADLDVMRQSLIFSGLEVVAHNLNRRQNDLKLFEFGKVYAKKEKNYTETTQLAIFLTGAQQPESWAHLAKPTDFYALAAAVNKVLAKFTFSYQVESADNPDFAYGLSYQANRQEWAILGQVHPRLCKKLGIKQPVFCALLDWSFLLANASKKVLFKEIPKFPEVRRDLSLVINKATSFASIKEVAFATERKLLQNVNVFDIYQGANLGQDKKSYSVSFILQDAQKTLEDKQIDKTMNRLIEAFERELGAIIRR